MGRSVSLRLSLLLHSLALVKQPRPSREVTARLRSLLLLREKTERIKTVCLTWLPSSKERSRPTSNRLRKLKKLQLLTWPSSGKLNKSLRRLKREQQIEEAEEIAALNLAKFRKAQQELEETEERA